MWEVDLIVRRGRVSAKGQRSPKMREDLTCVWIAGVCSLRAGIRSMNNVGVGVGNIRDKDIGNGPLKAGRVRGTYPIGTESLMDQRMHNNESSRQSLD